MTARTPLISGNWKMNLSSAEVDSLTRALVEAANDQRDIEIAVAPPAIWLERVISLAKDSALQVWGQNAAEEASGAFTGETSFPMLLDAGASGSLLGHSERRHVFGESNESVAKRAKLGVEIGARIILCVGEQLEDRKSGATMQVVDAQLSPALPHIPADKLVVAYEPVWAIGTGETATPEQAQETHAAIRETLRKTYGEKADKIQILYGGSVKPTNAAELLAQNDIDGVLVGGAALKFDSFSGIIAAAKS